MANVNKVLRGPSKFDFIVGTFHGHTDSRHTFYFDLEGPDFVPGRHHVRVLLDGISWEDGSGNCWNFQGWALELQRVNKRFKGFYRTDTRTGHLEFVK